MDWSSSSSSSSDFDDSDIEDFLFDSDMEHLVLLLLVQEHEAGHKRKRRGSTVGLLCIPHNWALGNALIMKDYLAKVTYFVGVIE